MKTLASTFLLLFLLSAPSQAESFFCVLKTKAGGHLLAPALVSRGAAITNGALSKYLIQTHSPATVLGIESRRLDYKKSYSLDFKAELRGQSQFFRINFTKGLGLIVTIVSDSGLHNVRYEFIEAKSMPTTISIAHRNGWTTDLACLPN